MSPLSVPVAPGETRVLAATQKHPTRTQENLKNQPVVPLVLRKKEL